MSVMLATLCLNEMEHLPTLYEQHKDWPDMVQWVFIESADYMYAKANPQLVNDQGLSTDGTTEYLCRLMEHDQRITYIPYGFTWSSKPDQGKCDARNQYLIEADHLKPDFIMVIDADEYYTYKHQYEINHIMHAAMPAWTSFLFRQRHIWRPPSIQSKPLFDLEVQGGYWAIPHCRAWRWRNNMRHTDNHNTPVYIDGTPANRKMNRWDRIAASPECVHLGFASCLQTRQAKHKYYVIRGEGQTDNRQWYVECRRSFETWAPGMELPHKSFVHSYNGPVPECFHETAKTQTN